MPELRTGIRLRTVGGPSTPVFTRPEWEKDAACVGLLDVFHSPDGERRPDRPQRVAAAAAICARCPVADKCLAEAKSRGEKWGVWGGVELEEPRPRGACETCGKETSPSTLFCAEHRREVLRAAGRRAVDARKAKQPAES